MNETRTDIQNRALHLWFRQVSEALNKEGQDVKVVMNKMKQGVDIFWTENLVKELLWREIQIRMFGKKSTTELLKREEIEKIYDPINKFLGQHLGIHVPFPSEENRID